MKFSVVIVEYDSWPLTLRCIESLKSTGYEDFEVVVADNGNLEPPALPPGTVILENGRNLGFARAVNRGVAASNAEIIVLINPDSTVEKSFFEEMAAFFEAHPKAGIAGPRVLDSDGEIQLSARREVSLVSGLFGRTSFLTRLLPESRLVKDEFPALSSETNVPALVDWVSGACMAVRRETLGLVGPLDERFFMYFEDADLCRRVRKAGYAIYYLPNVEVAHEAGGSTNDRLRAVWNLHKSAFLYHRKHGKRGPFGLASAAVFLGLAARGAAKLAASRLPAR